MKEYKYKINGLKFTVSVGDVVDNEVTVEVNGTPYMVELDKAAHAKPSKPALSQSGKTASAQPTAAPTQLNRLPSQQARLQLSKVRFPEPY